jgi:adenylate kinase
MEAGELVSDAIVSALIGERLDDAGEAGAIFDGYPRTRAQAEALDLLLAERGRALDHVIELCVDEDALVTRLAEYRAKTAPILPYYEERGLVRRVDGMGTPDDVAQEIDSILDNSR